MDICELPIKQGRYSTSEEKRPQIRPSHQSPQFSRAICGETEKTLREILRKQKVGPLYHEKIVLNISVHIFTFHSAGEKIFICLY